MAASRLLLLTLVGVSVLAVGDPGDQWPRSLQHNLDCDENAVSSSLDLRQVVGDSPPPPPPPPPPPEMHFHIDAPVT